MAEIKAAAAAEEAARKQVWLVLRRRGVPAAPPRCVPLVMSDVMHSICSGKKRQLQQQKKRRRRRRASRPSDSDTIPFLMQTRFIRKGSFISCPVRCVILGAQLEAFARFCDAGPLCQPLEAEELRCTHNR
jgi:hypothetical protein